MAQQLVYEGSGLDRSLVHGQLAPLCLGCEETELPGQESTENQNSSSEGERKMQHSQAYPLPPARSQPQKLPKSYNQLVTKPFMPEPYERTR